MTRHRLNPIDDSLEPDDLFDSIRSKIAQREKASSAEDIAVDLLPVVRESVAAPVAPSNSAGASIDKSPRLDIGEVLCGRYVIESQLGSGSMGTVYKALDRSRSEHTEADACVAIKVLHEKTRGRSEALAKLRREFYCAQALSHRSIIKVFELDLHQIPFFTMELIEGETLPSLMQRFHPMSLPRAYAWAIIREIGEGLAHAHERRVVHGDIEPQNVMLTSSGEVRILDFGTSNDSAATSMPAYASCDLLEGREPAPRDDLFALACLSYELLAGEHPFQRRRSTEARTLKIVPRRPPGMSGRQWKALSQGLAWERADRTASIKDWLADLDIGSAPIGPIPTPEISKPSLLSKPGAASALIALLAALIICGVAWAVLSRPKTEIVAADAAASDAVTAPLVADDAPLETDAGDAAPPDAQAVPKAAPKSRSAAASAGRAIDRTEKIGMAAASYSYRSGDKFAELRVHRSFASKGATSFQWWTEPASALAGTDFAPQEPATVVFPAGAHNVSLFVKLLPNAARKRNALFYVVLGNTSGGSSLSNVPKASITLRP
jgi:Protein kinase domain